MNTTTPIKNNRLFIELNVLFNSLDDDDLSIQKKVTIDFSSDKVGNGERDSKSLELEFSENPGRTLKVCAQATTWIDSAYAVVHLVAMDGDYGIGNTMGWVPLKHTISLNIENKDRNCFLECCVSYKSK